MVSATHNKLGWHKWEVRKVYNHSAFSFLFARANTTLSGLQCRKWSHETNATATRFSCEQPKSLNSVIIACTPPYTTLFYFSRQSLNHLIRCLSNNTIDYKWLQVRAKLKHKPRTVLGDDQTSSRRFSKLTRTFRFSVQSIIHSACSRQHIQHASRQQAHAWEYSKLLNIQKNSTDLKPKDCSSNLNYQTKMTRINTLQCHYALPDLLHRNNPQHLLFPPQFN